MKLMLVNYEYPPLGGGAGNATAYIAQALARQAHDVVVVTGAPGKLQGTQHELPNLKVIRLATGRKRVDCSNYAEMLSFVMTAARSLPRLVRENAADGLIVFFSLPCGPLGWLARRRTGKPYVISLRGGDVPGAELRVGAIHRLLAPLRRAVLREATAVVANSKGLARLSEQADSTPVSVIPNGVDAEFFSPPPWRDATSRPIRFLFAGRFQSQKNLFVLLDQFAHATRQSCESLRLTLIGDGPLRSELQKHSRRLGVDHLIEWPGWLDKINLRDAYRDADVFLNPSVYEGMPNTVLEAMACGLPVIATRVIGNDELVRHDETGILFDPESPDDLAVAITELAKAPQLRTSMGCASRRIAREHYSWDATAIQYAQLFSKNRP